VAPLILIFAVAFLALILLTNSWLLKKLVRLTDNVELTFGRAIIINIILISLAVLISVIVVFVLGFFIAMCVYLLDGKEAVSAFVADNGFMNNVAIIVALVVLSFLYGHFIKHSETGSVGFISGFAFTTAISYCSVIMIVMLLVLTFFTIKLIMPGYLEATGALMYMHSPAVHGMPPF
jgi:hypothetical protein